MLLPGLVNAHTHVELSWLGEQPPPAGDFMVWLRELLDRRGSFDPEAARQAAEKAVQRMVKRGTVAIGDVRADVPDRIDWAAVDASPVRVADPSAEAAMIAEVDRVCEALDTIGGVFEVRASGLPFGLGAHVQWDRRLDGQLAQAIMSVNAVKAVEIGDGVELARTPGSEAQDVILPADAWEQRPWERASNRSGGTQPPRARGMAAHAEAAPRAGALLRQLAAVVPGSGSERGGRSRP